jgi:hypothetical protein
MSVELAKRLSVIARQTDVESLRKIASDLAIALHAATTRQISPSNYVVMMEGSEMESGGRDYCVGYATAANRGSCGVYRVYCGTVEVWPDWGRGLDGAEG